MPLAKALKEWASSCCLAREFATRRREAHTSPSVTPLSYVQETRNTKVAADEKEIMLYGGMQFDVKRVFVDKLDASTATLKVRDGH